MKSMEKHTCIYHNEFYLKYIKNSYKTRTEGKQPNIKRSKDLHIHFSKKTNKHMNKYLTSLVPREKQIKSIMKYYFTPIVLGGKKRLVI